MIYSQIFVTLVFMNKTLPARRLQSCQSERAEWAHGLGMRESTAALCDITKCRVSRSVCFWKSFGKAASLLLGIFQITCKKKERKISDSPDCAPVTFDDLLAVSDRPLGVLHVETHPHGLVHHVQHVDVGLVEDGAHLVQALLAHLQQLSRGCQRVKVCTSRCGQEAFLFSLFLCKSLAATVKDILAALQGPELCDALPRVAHHVVDDLWLDGLAPLVHFQLCLVLGDKDDEKAEATTLTVTGIKIIIVLALRTQDSFFFSPWTCFCIPDSHR